ncbi:hypothetical protein AK812_SmicGene28586 [Symbiodinium microadriaticum]|uniref:2'-phosphotransferase n=1 Tax=Symbiodinium microadriaticum TaxID=2951 RepID=A0A1Q9D411_SYMMI|nr:hypothetical protein AK812_SmicGene28586 [Symbiodinium microadriaticum]
MSQWGSKRKEEKAQRLRGSFRARSDADRRRLVKILRHEAHFLGIPVREDGWVSLRDLNYYVGTTSREDLEVLAGRDNKQRMVLYTDRETWIAAESGHSMSGVVGLPVPTSPEEEEVQGHWGTKEASEPLEVLAKTARALGEVATEEDEEMPAADETAASGAPKRPKRVVLATGQLALLRALAAANASNWADIQRTLKETPGDAEDKEDLVNNLTDLAATFAKNRAECSKAAALKAEKLADLEGEEAEYLAALPPHLVELERKNPVRPSLSAHLGWVEHDRFKRDVEAAGVWMARRREKSRLRAAKHRASKQAETAGNTAQDPVADRADAGDHLSFQLGEAAREPQSGKYIYLLYCTVSRDDTFKLKISRIQADKLAWIPKFTGFRNAHIITPPCRQPAACDTLLV